MTRADELSLISLDALADRWRDGDPAAEARLFEELHVRFLSVAKRRVREEDAEDVVQDALKIVVDRFGVREEGPGILIWGYTVLRNVIGNHYQARDRERSRFDHGEDPHTLSTGQSAPADGLELDSLQRMLTDAIADLARRYPRCGSIFRAILVSLGQGGAPREITARALDEARRRQPDLKRNAFYVALHRCRGYLREHLAERDEGAEYV